MTDYIRLEAPNSPHPDPRQGGTAGLAAEALRGQVLGVISSVLEDTDPECAGARSQLRHILVHNAGSPEKALLEHLLHLHGSELCGSELDGDQEEPEEPEEPQD
ncbi:hypothetical protein ARGLB_083_01200 [Arthrobacter globiformis NBRC 12137]|uniref:Uncharacterized protein n=1 Tax=Arthrobacter globiformis (strain ATCC 8010 / DSM 20124 / JCM 1332 / NBRC 12137 / NCIMB 8907 / NRRL B-2979 / 168) TaxID=1077972 RepID=H0QQX9_ARTG1|nr:hypothetical protein [Arthrobacter globiformis]GAB15230.1 hypothetical protein ARGLB_083_01200 [Arthrobacter globiformis NBRC 12137]